MSVPSTKPWNCARDRAAAQHLGGLAHAVVTLLLLDADVEQADRGRGEPEHGAGEHVAHHRELDEIAGVAEHIGAEVEHDHVAARRWPDRGHRRAVDPGQRLEDDLGEHQQRAGIAGADHARRLVGGDRVDGDPHGGVAQAQRGGGLHVIADHVGRMADGASRRRASMAGEKRREARLVADQQEARVGMADGGKLQAVDDRLGRMIAAHRVHRQREGLARQMFAHEGSGPHGATARQARTAPFRALPAAMTSRPS